MEAKHTPGPWKHVATQGGWDGVEEPGGQLICHLRLNNPANARLIAAAPDLLAALEASNNLLWLAYEWGINNPFPVELHDNIEMQTDKSNAAIAKARGESPEPTGGPEAGYHPGSLADPRD